MNIALLLDLPAMMAPDDIVIDDGSSAVSYEQLRAGAARAAGVLESLGIARGARVGIFGVNSVAAVELIFACSALGGVSVPINYRASKPEVRHIAQDSGAEVIFADERYAELLAQARPKSVRRVVLLGEAYSALKQQAQETPGPADVEDSDLAVLIYTSGTTSLPKGVQLTHGGLSTFALESADVADGTDRGATLLSVPLYHVAGLSSMLVSVYGGRRILMMKQFEPLEWLKRAGEQRPTHAFLVPTMLRKLLNEPAFEQADLSSLQAISYGAAPMPLSTITDALRRLPEQIAFTGAYGMSETTSTVAVLGPEDHRRREDETEQEHRRRLSSVGRPIAGVELLVRTDERQVAAPHEVGEVFVRTGRAMTGYWGSQAGPAKVTIDEEGWLSSGDLGYLDEEGYVFLVGRRGDMIVRGGENIAPEEVEQVLLSHPDVLDAGVVGLPDEEWGERVGAAVVLRGNSNTSRADLDSHCRQLASFRRPDVIVIAQELPRTSTGKLLRRELSPVILEPAARD